MEISLENLFVDQGHRLLEERAGRRGGGGGARGSFLAQMKYLCTLYIPEGLSVTKWKNKRDQDHGLLTGYGKPSKGKAHWGRG